jgi:signal transduction histidine kinase
MSIMWSFAGTFALAAAVCLAAAARGSALRDPEARAGLRWLLLTVGAWSALQTGVLLAGTESVAVTLYTLELLVGFATVGPWLYFASAYAGHDYHRRPLYRRLAVGVYLLIAGLKLTNPIHGWYYSASFQAEPVRRLFIDHGTLYWGSFVLAYALTAIGFAFLYRLYRDSEHSSATLVGLFAITGVAVVPNTVSRMTTSVLPPLNYEPIGVALFALGTLYLVEDTFLAVEEGAKRSFVERTAGGIVILNDDGTVREFNERAGEMFSRLTERGPGTPLSAVAPAIASADDGAETRLVETANASGDERVYCVTEESLGIGGESFGRALLVQDVTAIERQRERLGRHEAQLGDMAGAIAHELRNSVSVADGYLGAAADQLAAGDVEAATESVTVADRRVARIGRIAEDLYTLVEYTRDGGDVRPVDLRTAVLDAADSSAVDVDVSVEGDHEIEAGPTRLKQLLKNAFRFAGYNEASEVTVRVDRDGFVIEDDGRYGAAGRADRLFEYESAEPTAEAGMSLPNVRALARVEGWTVAADPSYEGGLRYRISRE